MAKLFGNIPKARNKEEADALNRSFRNSDYDRWQTQDFVVGVEIRRSNNLDCNCEICKVGAGKYPKDFKWTGWHNECKCYIIPILKTEKEMASDTQRILRGKPTNTISENTVVKIPHSLKIFVEAHHELHENDWYVDNEMMFKK